MSTNDTSSKDDQKAYQVLARKYRPQNFDDLIGQDALVRTLKNAIESGRIAHAFMLTGIRGVGKTTTARIIAKALNYAGADGKSGPSVGNLDDCDIAKAIAADRHPDVMEMDAASRTGVDDIREILDGVRYAPSSARYKIYIIDEVHMLSKSAFNALLKTLEEPPEHVKFIFATTEIRKVPVTVLSRCQRFDLRRISTDQLEQHYKNICGHENASFEDDAIAMIARAADGSVRDGLSILDQAIALGDGSVKVDIVKDMLGLSDGGQSLELFRLAMEGKSAEALNLFDEIYMQGADPVMVFEDLLNLTHALTRMRLLKDSDAQTGEGPDYAAAFGSADAARELAYNLSIPALNRAWQLITKGIGEIRHAPAAKKAAEMALIRLIYTSDMPDPKDFLKKLESGGAVAGASASGAAMSSGGGGDVGGASASQQGARPEMRVINGGGGSRGATAAQAVAVAADYEEEHNNQQDETPERFDDVEALYEFLRPREVLLAAQIRDYVQPISFDGTTLSFSLRENASKEICGNLKKALLNHTGKSFSIVLVSDKKGQPSLAERDEAKDAAELEEVRNHENVQVALQAFPGAELIEVVKN